MSAALLECPAFTADYLEPLLAENPGDDDERLARATFTAMVLDLALPLPQIAIDLPLIDAARDLLSLEAVRTVVREHRDRASEPEHAEPVFVAPITTTRFEYGMDAAEDGRITAQLRMRILGRVFGLASWCPVVFSEPDKHQRFLEWAGDAERIRDALESIRDGQPERDEERALATMVSGLRRSELDHLLESDPRVLQAFALAASDPSSLSASIREGIARMLKATFEFTMPDARFVVSAWADGADVAELGSFCSDYRKRLEVAQTYRLIAP